MQKLSRDELIQLVERIRNVQTEEESDTLMTEFLSNVPHPGALNLFRSRRRLSAEEIVDTALAYKPIQL